MNTQKSIDFKRIQEAIEYINSNYKVQPDLNDIAKHLNISPFHFQRLFTDWAGVSPKQFLQYISINHAKEIIKESQTTLFDVAYEIGLSGTGRLHDLFVNIEGMTPGEYKNGGKNLSINYSYSETLFGEILIASTSKGICFIGFADNEKQVLEELKALFPNATYDQHTDNIQKNAISIFSDDWNNLDQIKLHLKGTDFQLKVWEALLKIPMGKLSTYNQVAQTVENPKANRAVGSAIANNPVAFLVPCHRIIRSNGLFGQYHWGTTRKTALIGWESSKFEKTV